MRSIRTVFAAIVLVVLMGFFYFVQSRAGQPITEGELAPVAGSGKTPFTSSAECAECHKTIYEEWRGSMHRAATTDPIYLTFKSTGYGQPGTMAECNLCHIPSALFEGTLGQYPRTREYSADPEPGVTCLSCHQMGERVVGVQGLTGAGKCNPISDARLRSAIYCGSCHQNQQKRLKRKHEWEEWKERSEFTKDQTCVDCHMEPVERPLVEGGPVRTGHDHKMAVVYDPEFLRSAFDVDVQVMDGQVVLAITNTGTGHRLPTGYRIRDLRLKAWVPDPEGGEAPLWSDVYRVHRQSVWGGENNQIWDHEVRIYRYPPMPETITEGTVKFRAEFSVAGMFGPPPTVFYEKEQVFPHDPRPLPEEVVPPPIEQEEKVSHDTSNKYGVGWFGIMFLGVLFLWLLGWGSLRRE